MAVGGSLSTAVHSHDQLAKYHRGLGSDSIMSLGIKSSATEGGGYKDFPVTWPSTIHRQEVHLAWLPAQTEPPNLCFISVRSAALRTQTKDLVWLDEHNHRCAAKGHALVIVSVGFCWPQAWTKWGGELQTASKIFNSKLRPIPLARCTFQN